jgi:hypothetical protein
MSRETGRPWHVPTAGDGGRGPRSPSLERSRRGITRHGGGDAGAAAGRDRTEELASWITRLSPDEIEALIRSITHRSPTEGTATGRGGSDERTSAALGRGGRRRSRRGHGHVPGEPGAIGGRVGGLPRELPRSHRRTVNRQSIEGGQAGRDIVQKMWVIEHGIVITVTDRDQTLYTVRGVQRRQPPTSSDARRRPALLLGGKAAVTGFVGRDAEMTTLTQWYGAPDRVSVMLVHGAGGQGKTRLLREFADSVRGRPEQPLVCEAIPLTEAPAQWKAGEDQDDGADEDHAAPTGVLLLVDEADTWPTGKLATLIGDATAWRAERVRVLLAARAAGMWWTGLHAEVDSAQPEEPQVTWQELHLGPLPEADIPVLAEAARHSLADALEWPVPPPPPEEVMNWLTNSPPLSVELMVLARAHAHHAGQPMPGDLRAAVEMVLEKEVRYWARMYSLEQSDGGEDPNRIHVQPSFMVRVVYVATLTGPRGLHEALEVLRLADTGCDIDPQQVIVDHARCYPPEDDSTCLAPLPACVAEEFLGMLVRDPARKGKSSRIAHDGWATDVPFHVLGLLPPQERDAEEHRRQQCRIAGVDPAPTTPKYSPDHTFGPQLLPTILRLVRAASTRPHLAEQQLYPLAQRYPKAVVMAGETALIELTRIDPKPPGDVLQELKAAVKEIGPDALPYYQAAMAAAATC